MEGQSRRTLRCLHTHGDDPVMGSQRCTWVMVRFEVTLCLCITALVAHTRVLASVPPSASPTPTQAAPGCCDLSAAPGGGGCFSISESSDVGACASLHGVVRARFACDLITGACGRSPEATATPTPSPIPVSPTPRAACVGDCNLDGAVSVDELMVMVNIALGNKDASVCPQGGLGSSEIDVALILEGINNALDGCGSR